MIKRIGAMVLAFGVVIMGLAQDVRASYQGHGTVDYQVTENMLDNNVPENYVINEKTQGKARKGEYNRFFLKDDIQEVNITISEDNFSYIVQNARDKESAMATSVTIGGETVQYVGLKTKGCYTLEHTFVDNKGSDRFSFTINFGKYVDGQNFFGCKKISFNNFFFDKSMLKEYVSYMILQEMGLPTPQFGLAKVYINGGYYGVYFMVEAMDDTILQQYYDVKKSEMSAYLVKPEGTTFLYDELRKDSMPLFEDDKDTYKKLKDEEPRVLEWVEKLNLLSEGRNWEHDKIDVNTEEYIKLLGQIMDVDEVVKYFAAHSFLVQIDNMFVEQHNFGLYIDNDGKCVLIPWDYDLSFGCYFPGDAESTINYSVDVLMRGGDLKPQYLAKEYRDYPLFNVIYQNDELMERYHNYMIDCCKIAVFGGKTQAGQNYEPGYIASCITVLEDKLTEAASIKTAPNVYYLNGATQPANVVRAIPTMKRMVALRAASVYSQIANLDTKVSAGGCDLSTLGNGMRGFSSTKGKLISIDENTGIMVSTDYGQGNRAVPRLITKEVEPSNSIYSEIKSKINKQNARIFEISNMAKAVDGYEIYIPKAYFDIGGTVSTYNKGVLEKVELTLSGEMYVGKIDNASYLIIATTKSMNVVLVTVVVVGALFLCLILFFVIKKIAFNKRKKGV